MVLLKMFEASYHVPKEKTIIQNKLRDNIIQYAASPVCALTCEERRNATSSGLSFPCALISDS